MKLDETPVTPKEPFNSLVRAGKARKNQDNSVC